MFALWTVPLLGNAQPVEELPDVWELNPSYDAEQWMDHGDVIQPGSRFMGLATVALTLNGDALQLHGFTAYASTLWTHGALVNDELAGTAQGISNIEADSAWRLYELWGEWLYSDNDSVRVGLYDLNAEFDVIDTAALFINPSHGIGPDFSQSGENGPSIFPTTSLGLRSWHHRGIYTFQFAALDGVPGDPQHPTRSTIRLGGQDGLLLVGEASLATLETLRLAAGYWRYTGSFADLDAVATSRHDNQGFYSLLDARLLQQAEDRLGLDAFIRYGQANAHINAIDHYLGAGVVFTGLLRERPADQLGLSYAGAHTGTPFMRASAAQDLQLMRSERIVEFTYAMPINSWLTLQPDVQHVVHPAFDPERNSEWLFGLRLSMGISIRR